jgi:hypothetical protein
VRNCALGTVGYNAVMASSMAEDWLTVAQAAAVSGYHIIHIRRLLLSGAVRGRKWGRDWQVSNASLQQYMKTKQREGRKRGPKSTS